MYKTKIVIINAPPNAGKDYAAEKFAKWYGTIHQSFKYTLIKITCAIYGVSVEWWNENYTREQKEIPMDVLGGRSMRQALIHTSENVIKPIFGNDWFGKLTKGMIIQDEINIFSDGGFIEEMIPLTELDAEILLIRMTADGCSFDNDSRDFITDEDLSEYGLTERVSVVDYHNNKTAKDLENLWRIILNSK